MRLTEIAFEGQPPIDGYGPGGFRVAGTWIEGSVILSPEGADRIEGPVSADAVAHLLDSDVDVILIGQGADMAPLDRGIRERIESAGIGVEHMATPSACRTYNVMLAEERRVGALLIAL